MASVIKHTTTSQRGMLGKLRSYNEVVAFLDGCIQVAYEDAVLKRMKALDTVFDRVSTKLDTVVISGTNGKSSTLNFTARLLQEEGYNVGVLYSSHVLTYPERITINSAQVPQKTFTDATGEVIDAAQLNKIDASVHELMTMTALRIFAKEGVDIVLLEAGLGGRLDATAIVHPKIAAVTRVAYDHGEIFGDDLDNATCEMLGLAKKGTWVISAEQSKLRLQTMKEQAEAQGAKWAMPIRKLAPLPYIFEQLYGRSASLAERITQLYVEDIQGRFSPFLRGNLLATKRGQRGRPTLEAKRKAELNPIKTLKMFWSEEFNLLRGRFELLDKEKPSILLDGARNLDALDNLFLGIRLLHYQRPLKGHAMVLGIDACHSVDDVVKLIRYLCKKVPGEVIFVPLKTPCHEPATLAAAAKELGLKTRACPSFAEGFAAAKAAVDERDGLVTVSGSKELVTEYWKLKGIKKFS